MFTSGNTIALKKLFSSNIRQLGSVIPVREQECAMVLSDMCLRPLRILPQGTPLSIGITKNPAFCLLPILGPNRMFYDRRKWVQASEQGSHWIWPLAESPASIQCPSLFAPALQPKKSDTDLVRNDQLECSQVTFRDYSYLSPTERIQSNSLQKKAGLFWSSQPCLSTQTILSTPTRAICSSPHIFLNSGIFTNQSSNIFAKSSEISVLNLSRFSF